MATWQEVKERVLAYRNYVQGLPPAAKAEAKYAFTITKEDIKNLLEQAGGAQELDGIRIYMAAQVIDSKLVPSVYAVAVKKDAAGGYNDYELTETFPPNPQPLLANTRPCPTMCSKKNFLNS